MKILYCSYSQVPSVFANSIAVMKQCDALNKVVELQAILVRGNSCRKRDVFHIYGVRSFPLILLPKWMLCFREFGLKIFLLLYALFYQPDIVYSRDIFLNEWLCKFRIKNIYEIHQLDQADTKFDHLYKKKLSRTMHCQELKAIVCISKSLLKECVDFGVPEKKIIVMHSGVDLRESENVLEIDVPEFKYHHPLAVYVGSLQKGKGIELIIQMAEEFSDYNFLIVGGKMGEIKEKDNMKHIARVSHVKALAYMKKADFLLLPLTEQIYKFHSPLKLFEYLSMGKTVIASDNADMREIIIPMENAMLANPNLPRDFVQKMDTVLQQPELKKRLERNAKQTSTHFTWDARAKKIVCLIKEYNN